MVSTGSIPSDGLGIHRFPLAFDFQEFYGYESPAPDVFDDPQFGYRDGFFPLGSRQRVHDGHFEVISEDGATSVYSGIPRWTTSGDFIEPTDIIVYGEVGSSFIVGSVILTTCPRRTT